MIIIDNTNIFFVIICVVLLSVLSVIYAMQIIKSYRKKKYLKKKKVTIRKISNNGIKACHSALKERKKLTKKDIEDRKKRVREFNAWFK